MNVLWRVSLSLGGLVSLAAAAPAQEVDTIRVGSAALRTARLALGTFTIESFQRADGQDTPISSTTQEIDRARRHDLDVYLVRSVHRSGDDTTVSTTVVRSEDFALLHHHVKGKQDSAMVTVNAGYLTGWVDLPGGPAQLIDRHLDRPVFPVEGQVPWLFPLLPLAKGYRAAIPHYSEWENRENWVTIEVRGGDRISLGGKVFECWEVDGGELFPGYRVTYWVDKETHRIVRGVARGPATEPEYLSQLRINGE